MKKDDDEKENNVVSFNEISEEINSIESEVENFEYFTEQQIDEMDRACAATRIMFDLYVIRGFTEDQALKLCIRPEFK